MISPGPYQDCVVWLEDRGTRIISSTGLPREITRPLFRWIWANRESIEARWLRFMSMKGWLGVRVEWDQLQLVCYRGEPPEFVRPLNVPVWTDRERRSP